MVIKKVEKLVKQACLNQANQFERAAWDFHIRSVVRLGKKLAKKLKADVEIVELAALLHDYAAVKNFKWSKEHHIYGARLAEEILTKLDYPKEKIRAVKHCIYSHRASKQIKRKTIEAEILASADAMAHMVNVPALLYLAFKIHGKDANEGIDWVRSKLKRSYKKIMPEAKKMIKEDYLRALKILS